MATLEHEGLFAKVVALSKERMLKKDHESAKVIDFKTPEELKSLIDFKCPTEGIDDDSILELCKAVLKYSVDTSHPHFYNQLFTGADEVGIMASFISAAANTSVYTFEMAPVFSLMENEVLRQMREIIGWEGGKGDGIFSPGGSMSNLYGLVLARFCKAPESKQKGITVLPQMAIFCSEDAHYSVFKAAFIAGLGIENAIKVKTDSRGKMIPAELDKAIEEAKARGITPLAVVATAATTVVGAYDPLNEVADVCEKHKMWMHVDGSLGASVLMSRKHRSLAAGIERADSVVWNAHKCLHVPQQCSAFLTRHEDKLKACNSTGATYLFQQDKLNYKTTYDTGDKSFQCGRLNDAFKFWLMWKQKGTLGFEKMIDSALHCAQYLAEKVKQREGFQMARENPEFTNVCFWYFPPKMRDLYPFTTPFEPAAAARLTKVAPIIKARMIEKGSAMITYQPLKGLPNFFRMTLITSASETDMDWLLDEIERLGNDIDISSA